MSSAQPILYSFRRCPYAMRARLAIAISQTSCRLREVVLRNKPAAMLDASPKGTVPVLVLTDGQVIDESLDIMRWALGQNDPEGWQGLDDVITAKLIAEADGPFKYNLDRYKYPNRYDGAVAETHRLAGLEFLKTLNTRLTDHPNLLGDARSLADIAIFPFVRQFANTDRAWFDAQPLAPLQAWLNTHLESDLFQSIMAKYTPWAPGDTEPVFPPEQATDQI